LLSDNPHRETPAKGVEERKTDVLDKKNQQQNPSADDISNEGGKRRPFFVRLSS
jgi:hypothetical protein